MDSQPTTNRRDFMGSVALASLPLAATMAGAARAASQNDASRTGLIIREKEPVNFEFPFADLQGARTPTNSFFIRTHFAMPTIKSAGWKLTVDGETEQELALSYDDLRNLPSETVPVLLECAGNGRAQVVPKAKGLLWESGAVGTADWTGVPLSTVLAKAGVKKGAVEVVLQGADSGEIKDEPKSPGVIPFERSLPMAKALQPEVLLAYQMNGKELPREHGFPVRAIVGGWYGMASVKWLTRITVSATPFVGFWQSLEYAYFRRDRGQPTLTPVTAIQVKAQIARPAFREVVPAGKPYRVFGAAWAGESDVARVEFSADGGKTWAAASLLGATTPLTWRLWEFQWDAPKTAGRHVLMARATDSKGRTQPAKHDKDRRNYMINFVAPVEVEVV
jgi:DMSO/TMAO reductase YedYZ molybdopterin-dependent catalytic subunit